eukprot:UN23444
MKESSRGEFSTFQHKYFKRKDTFAFGRRKSQNIGDVFTKFYLCLGDRDYR